MRINSNAALYGLGQSKRVHQMHNLQRIDKVEVKNPKKGHILGCADSLLFSESSDSR